MTMPASGTISMSQINTELGRSSTATISLDTAENGGYATINTASSSRPNGSNPASMSEWYSYNHNASSGTTITWKVVRYLTGAGGLLTITKNGTTVVQSSTNGAAGTFAAVAGDNIYITLTENFKLSDRIDIRVDQNSYGGGELYASTGINNGTISVSFTVQAIQFPYFIRGIQDVA